MYHNDEAVIAAVMDNPAAPSLVARLQTALDLERHRRQQFYAEMDESDKTEFINGEVIIHSPVKIEHSEISTFIVQLFNTFVRVNKLGFVGHEKILISLTRNDYEPDLVYFNKEKANNFKRGQWQFPVPDFVIEILSNSTKDRDRGIKYDDYAAHGISEYWIIDPEDESVEQYLLHEKNYKLNLKAHKGIIESTAIQGLSMDIRAIFDESVNMRELKRILG